MSAPEPISCPACATKILPPARYCDACGAPLAKQASRPPKPSA
ncbi:MAG TPA: zinc-ribbon domain-containing protein [Candidatus Methylomirabilis sp.]|jgi:uncharacterized OB-fold protein|nr:zinc-ribbon domain-containing protein [Candidatus Methylomirabilis sp.]